ncbi:MAG: nicotinate (nicotinamide) nucleotide adenylyltransferase [Bacteroidales bacterium]
MRIGLFSGSFDPIHIGHLIIADYMCQYAGLDEVWLSASPQNPMKGSENITEERHRIAMVKSAITGNIRLKYCNIESKMPLPSYTVNTLKTLSETYTKHEFSLIIGADNWLIFNKWKDYKYIIEKYRIMIYPRMGYDIKQSTLPAGVTLYDTPVIGISSTFIRDGFNGGKQMNYYITEGVYKYIIKNSLYK